MPLYKESGGYAPVVVATPLLWWLSPCCGGYTPVVVARPLLIGGYAPVVVAMPLLQ